MVHQRMVQQVQAATALIRFENLRVLDSGPAIRMGVFHVNLVHPGDHLRVHRRGGLERKNRNAYQQLLAEREIFKNSSILAVFIAILTCFLFSSLSLLFLISVLINTPLAGLALSLLFGLFAGKRHSFRLCSMTNFLYYFRTSSSRSN